MKNLFFGLLLFILTACGQTIEPQKPQSQYKELVVLSTIKLDRGYLRDYQSRLIDADSLTYVYISNNYYVAGDKILLPVMDGQIDYNRIGK